MKNSINISLSKYIGILLVFFSSAVSYSCKDDVSKGDPEEQTKVIYYLTDPSAGVYFSQQQDLIVSSIKAGIDVITMDPLITFQEMDGFGCALTGGSAYHIFNMSASARHQLLTELFDPADKNIGISFLRISIGASDLDAKVFSYDDLPEGQTDTSMQNFSIAEDRKFLIPVLKEILSINPDIKIMGSPWSAPLWMKTNKASIGGSLKTEYYPAYTKYFVKYIQEYAKEGINIYAITVQNEPLHGGNNPSMLMLANEQAAFIKYNLGPSFRNTGIQTKIIIYDHNADRVDYPMTVLSDPAAKQYIDGSAFHLYGGEISTLSQLHNSHTDKNIYFTEQWVGAGSDFAAEFKWHIRELTIGAVRNWCKTVLEWNLAADQNQEPHTDGGCTECLGSVTIQGDQVTRNTAYYIMAHASKFVRPGSRRIDSNIPAGLPNVAFLTPDGKKVSVILNDTDTKKVFYLKLGSEAVMISLSAGAAGTFIW